MLVASFFQPSQSPLLLPKPQVRTRILDGRHELAVPRQFPELLEARLRQRLHGRAKAAAGVGAIESRGHGVMAGKYQRVAPFGDGLAREALPLVSVAKTLVDRNVIRVQFERLPVLPDGVIIAARKIVEGNRRIATGAPIGSPAPLTTCV